jgi:ferric-dicitrate binding protein FerR (iron transport regulator)
MSDPTRPPGTPPEEIERDDAVARLVRLGGPRPAVSAERRARVREAVHQAWSGTTRRERRGRLVGSLLRLAAAVALVAGSSLWLWQRLSVTTVVAATFERSEGSVRLQDGSGVRAGRAIAAGAEVTTDLDGRAALRLQDGASLRLDRGSAIVLVSERRVELRRGAVYADSGDGGRIEIATSFGLVRDVGTRFEVRLTDDALRLSVRAGAVVLSGRAGASGLGSASGPPGSAGDLRVAAGRTLRVDRSGAVETGTIEAQGDPWAWTLAIAPPFEMDGRPLRDYLDWLSRETGWSVRFDPLSIESGAREVILHGSAAGLRPDETPDAVLPACGLEHRLEGATLVLSPAGGAPRQGVVR